MTEKDKMISGGLYIADDPQLKKDRLNAKKLCFAFNHLEPEASSDEILQSLLGKKGENCEIMPSFHCDYGYHIKMGANFFSNYNLVILDCAPVTFGDNVMIGPNVSIYTAGHPIDVVQRTTNLLEYAKPISIGDNVWIGGNVCILPGVTIGNNVVIGAGSVVTKDIPDDVVAFGNPCKIVKYLGKE